MRIAINARFLHPDKMEGIGRYSYETIRRIVDNHPEDTFLLLTDNNGATAFTFPQNVTIKKIGLLPARHPLLFLLWFEFSVRRALKKFGADVFYSPDGFIPTLKTVPCVPVIHDIAWKHFPKHVKLKDRLYYRWMTPRFCRKAAKIITVSKFSKLDLMKFYNLPSSKIVVTGNACSPDFHPIDEIQQMQIRRQYTEQKDYFFYVGALHPRKNIVHLIKAFDIFKQESGSNMKLLLAGRMAWKNKKFKKTLDSLAAKDDIIQLGFVPNEDLPLLMGSAFALTYISLFEGFGVPLLEAMAADVPVITSTVSSLPEVAGDAALTVNPNDPKEIAQAMITLRKNVDLYNELVDKGRKRVKEFSWDDYAKTVYDVLAQKRAGTPIW